jgi:hypothetical protein
VAERIELTDQMKAQIGNESPPWDFEVTTTSVRMFARGVGYTDPVYYGCRCRQEGRLPQPARAADVSRHRGVPARAFKRHVQRTDRRHPVP